MKPVSLIFALVVTMMLLGSASQQNVPKESSNKVLLILRGRGKADIQYLVTNEAVVMKNMLEEAGFDVVPASALGQTFVRSDIIIEPNLKLADVKVADYVGFILPCMSIGTWYAASIPPEVAAIVKQVVAEGKPIAAQRGGVVTLALAGVLAGRQYSYERNVSRDPRFAEAIHSGKGVVQDGNIITSAYCPHRGSLDQTVELTKALIAELQK